MSRIRIRELYYLGPHYPGLQRQQTCFWSVVQFPRVALEAYPPRADPPVNLVLQVWGFSHGASRIGKRSCLAVLLPRGIEDYLRCRCKRNRHAHGLRLAV